MAENKVSVEITVEQQAAMKALGILGREINKQEKNFAGLGKEADASLGVIGKATSGVSAGFGKLVGGVTIANLASDAIVGTANAIKSFVVESVNSAIEQENAINRLSQALKSSGSFSDEALKSFIDFGSEMQKVSIYGDEVVVGQLAVAKSFGASNDQAKLLVQAAANLSATFGGSLDSNVEKLGKTFSGQAGKLAQFIPELKGLTEQQLKSGAAFEIVNSKFGGAAANELKTYAGAVIAADNAFSDFQEEMGALITQNPLVLNSLNGQKSVWEALGSYIKNEFAPTFNSASGNILRFFSSDFSKSEQSINQQSQKFSELTAELERAEAEMNRLKAIEDKGFFDKINLSKATSEVINLKSSLQTLGAEINARSKTTNFSDAPQPQDPKASGGTVETGLSKQDQALIDSRNAAYAQIEISRATFNQQEIEMSVAKQQITEENYAFELQRLQDAEAMKIEAVYAAEEAKANAMKDAKSGQLAIEKAQIDKEMALSKSRVDTKKKLDDQQVALEQQKQAAMAGAALAGLNLLGSIAKDGSKEQFLIQKAAAIGSAAIAAKVAYMQALAFPPGPPATIPTASWVAAAGVANVAAIVATSLKGFEQGGIVAGTSMTGDNIGVRVNSGEMILNRQQQTQLFSIANGSGGAQSSDLVDEIRGLKNAISSQPVNLTIDGRVLATVIRNQVQSGFKIA